MKAVLFDVNGDDADESKPAPDIIEAALQRAEARPHEALMIGDTPYDNSRVTMTVRATRRSSTR